MNKFESKEDYLERILMLTEKKGSVRAIDIATDMGYSKASVSIALKKLKNEHFIIVDEKTGNVNLTESGLKIAKNIYDRHRLLTNILMHIGVSEQTAEDDACKIEHDLSEETLQRLKETLARVK